LGDGALSLCFSFASHRSAKADEGQNGENDDDGSNEPYDTVHDCLLSQFATGGSSASNWVVSINQANPTRFKTAMTITTAPTNQTMLFMTFSY
jgi:hypothetical protein